MVDLFLLIKGGLLLAALLGLLVWFLLERRAQHRYDVMDARITNAVETRRTALRKRFTPIPPRHPLSIQGYPPTPPRDLPLPFRPLE